MDFLVVIIGVWNLRLIHVEKSTLKGIFNQ